MIRVSLLIFLLAAPAFASESALRARGPALAPETPVVAVNEKTGASLRAGDIFSAGAEPVVLIDKLNRRFELAPHAVMEFGADSEARLFRGSVIASAPASAEGVARTTTARVDFTGRVLLSYDHREQSTSVFALEGEARLVNPHADDRSLRVERHRGATMLVGGVMPQLVRQLDLAGVREWMNGYGWPEARVNSALANLPGVLHAEAAPPAAHVREAKLEDYFSAIDGADEAGQPDYYQQKFADPDRVVAEANAKKETTKVLRPEDAALIALPSTKIDLGFEADLQILSVDEKAKELKGGSRMPASLPKAVKSVKAAKPVKVRAPAQKAEEGDPDLAAVLERLRNVRSREPVVSRTLAPAAPVSSRGPASVGGAVPDPVYDYSQNF